MEIEIERLPGQDVLSGDVCVPSEAERARLKGDFVTALRPYIGRAAAAVAQTMPFPEIPSTTNRALFFDPSEVLTRIGEGAADKIDYRFNEPSAFYLRLIPTQPRAAVKFTELYDLVQQRRIDVLTRVICAGYPDRNRYGAIAFEPHGTSTTPRAFTQIFPNGEFWGITTDFFQRHGNDHGIPTVNVENICERVLGNYCSVAIQAFGIAPPYQIAFGAVGLTGRRLGISNQGWSGLIHSDGLHGRRVLNEVNPDSQRKLIDHFMDALFDLAGERRS